MYGEPLANKRYLFGYSLQMLTKSRSTKASALVSSVYLIEDIKELHDTPKLTREVLTRLRRVCEVCLSEAFDFSSSTHTRPDEDQKCRLNALISFRNEARRLLRLPSARSATPPKDIPRHKFTNLTDPFLGQQSSWRPISSSISSDMYVINVAFDAELDAADNDVEIVEAGRQTEIRSLIADIQSIRDVLVGNVQVDDEIVPTPTLETQSSHSRCSVSCIYAVCSILLVIASVVVTILVLVEKH